MQKEDRETTYSGTRFNEVPRDWGNWFVISRFFSMRYTITRLKNIVRYTGDFVL